MRASCKWLSQLVPALDASPRELADRLTGAGLEVEAILHVGAAAAACVFARVTSVRPHPSKSGLRLVTVDRGGGTQEVVCGAPNVPDPGGLVLLAPLGTALPGGTIERRTIGGVASEGMLVSEAELGLSEDGEGILVFAPDGATPGATFASAIPEASDTILEIGLGPNRPDGLGHVGLAREIAALYNVPFRRPPVGDPIVVARDKDLAAMGVEVSVLDLERCPHYAAALVIDVEIGPSPPGARYRLAHLGVRAISNVVDVTNLAMLAYGQPMHAFDLDLVRGGRIVVRRARAGEVLVTLDGVSRPLDEDDLLICDGEGPVALAGVMGGQGTEIRAETRRVLFECASFEPRGIRRAARRHGMHTESSHRFERGTDRAMVRHVLRSAIRMTTELAPGARAVKGEIHVEGAPATVPRLTLRRARMDALLGLEVPWSEARAMLARLGCVERAADDDAAEVDAPSHRLDLTREVDLIEEVIRVHGMNAVPATLPRIQGSRPVGGVEELTTRARRAALAMGLSEAITWAFTSEEALEKVAAPHASVVLANPLARHHGVMRTSLLPGLFEAVAHGRRHGVTAFQLFSLGARYLATPRGSADGLPEERPSFAAVLAGTRPAYLAKGAPFDVWDAKAVALGVVERMTGRACEIQRGAARHLHPRGAADLFLDGTIIGAFGPVHPDLLDAFELGEHAVVVEIDLEALRAHAPVRYRDLPRFPASPRDVALVVHDDVAAGALEAAIREAAGALAEEVSIFDRFTGGAIPADHASLAFRVVYRAPDRTLTDAEIDAAHARVVDAVNSRFGAKVRT